MIIVGEERLKTGQQGAVSGVYGSCRLFPGFSLHDHFRGRSPATVHPYPLLRVAANRPFDGLIHPPGQHENLLFFRKIRLCGTDLYRLFPLKTIGVSGTLDQKVGNKTEPVLSAILAGAVVVWASSPNRGTWTPSIARMSRSTSIDTI